MCAERDSGAAEFVIGARLRRFARRWFRRRHFERRSLALPIDRAPIIDFKSIDVLRAVYVAMTVVRLRRTAAATTAAAMMTVVVLVLHVAGTGAAARTMSMRTAMSAAAKLHPLDPSLRGVAREKYA